jgi:hypothetical protein
MVYVEKDRIFSESLFKVFFYVPTFERGGGGNKNVVRSCVYFQYEQNPFIELHLFFLKICVVYTFPSIYFCIKCHGTFSYYLITSYFKTVKNDLFFWWIKWVTFFLICFCSHFHIFVETKCKFNFCQAQPRLQLQLG